MGNYYQLCKQAKNRLWNMIQELNSGDRLKIASLTFKMGLEYGLGENFVKKELAALSDLLILEVDLVKGEFKKL